MFRRTFAMGATLILAPLFAPAANANSAGQLEAPGAPNGPACSTTSWAGDWVSYTGTGPEPEHRGNVKGNVKLTQDAGSSTVTGTYDYSGGGHIRARAFGTGGCLNLVGRWSDTLGQGDFYVNQDDPNGPYFMGTYRRCTGGCGDAERLPWVALRKTK
jgi:hypothetical protein